MLIPVKCFTCGKVIGDKYNYYIQEIIKRKGGTKDMPNQEDIQYLDESSIHKTVEGELLDELKMTDMCCRRHFLTHVNIF
jgi:DNA-directed RNA polymerase I, II, and III subunit RPABC5